jgi:hypothetical protein
MVLDVQDVPRRFDDRVTLHVFVRELDESHVMCLLARSVLESAVRVLSVRWQV